MTDLPADWAIERAVEKWYTNTGTKVGLAMVKSRPTAFQLTIAFARYISEHEAPPVDPDLLIARRAVVVSLSRGSTTQSLCSNVLSGNQDEGLSVRSALAGIKLYKERNDQKRL